MSMEYAYTQGDIIIDPYVFEKILNLNLIREINEHTRFYIRGIISDELSDDYVEKSGSFPIIRVLLKDDIGNRTEIFQGMVTNVSISSFNNVKTLEVEATSNTFMMDIEKKSRSFQGDNLTYRDIFNQINSVYGNVQMQDYASVGRCIDKMVIQYNETDWEFLKRLSSHFNMPVIPECTLGGIKYSLGKSWETVIVCNLGEFNYSVNKGLDEYQSKVIGNTWQLTDLDFITYEVVTNKILNLFSSVNFKGKTLIVYKCEVALISGVFSNKYYLRFDNGMIVKKLFNENISGASLNGKVLAVEKDQVKASLEIDGYSNTVETTIWMPYSTVFSSPDGTGWYCMPEIGDAIRVYFPDNTESNGYVISSVNLETSDSSKRSDPSVKSISTKYGKEIIMRPGAIDIISGGNSMSLNDNGGISISSGSSISMSGSSINISGGYVSISGGGGVKLSQNGASISIKNDIVMSGVKINTQ